MGKEGGKYLPRRQTFALPPLALKLASIKIVMLEREGHSSPFPALIRISIHARLAFRLSPRIH